jgi:hypothetical protein
MLLLNTDVSILENLPFALHAQVRLSSAKACWLWLTMACTTGLYENPWYVLYFHLCKQELS